VIRARPKNRNISIESEVDAVETVLIEMEADMPHFWDDNPYFCPKIL